MNQKWFRQLFSSADSDHLSVGRPSRISDPPVGPGRADLPNLKRNSDDSELLNSAARCVQARQGRL